ncbi:hypothetical protein D3OALGA1CA_2096 [Olavius algarvensis associated proteobacterium Delta 3]|nr:hypothetical protein D3OALGA1CA_2096 [Olavius algarvensis associated proteobacterium Delta 3]CAB5121092.1 hypothetical protein D3OALGB2SA_2990 [Olavius algarvensis associated proteobacterium Delta 3]
MKRVFYDGSCSGEGNGIFPPGSVADPGNAKKLRVTKYFR